MDFFMIQLENIKNAFENMFAVILFLFLYKRRQTMEDKDAEKICNTFNDLQILDHKSENLINQVLTFETNNEKIIYQSQSKTISYLESVDFSLQIINSVINEKVKPKEAPDPKNDIDFNAIEDHSKEKYDHSAINNRMFNYRETRDYWESISQLKK